MHNVITARTCTRYGISPTTVRNALRCCLRKLNHGIYVGIIRCPRHPELVPFLDDDGILAIRSAGIDRATRADIDRVRRSEFLATISAYKRYDDGDVLGLTAAAVLHGIPLVGSTKTSGPRIRRRPGPQQEVVSTLSLGEPGTPVHLDVWNPVRPYRSTWITRRLSDVDPSHLTTMHGVPVTTAARTCVDLARAGTAFDGTVAMDFVLAQALERGGAEERGRVQQALLECVGQADRTPGVRRARIAVDTASGLSESVAESLALHWFRVLKVTPVQQQVEIYDDANELVGRVDFLLTAEDDTPVVVEIDGAVKYDEPALVLAGGAQHGDSRHSVNGNASKSGGGSGRHNPLFREKLREDRIRRLGYRVVRVTWKDLMSDMKMILLLREAGVEMW